VVVSVIWDNHDEGGLRHFPFSFFVILPKKILVKNKDFINLLTPIWENIEKFYKELEDIKDISSFYNHFRGIDLELNKLKRPQDDDFKDLRSSSFQKYSVSLFGEDYKECWIRFLESFTKMMQDQKRGWWWKRNKGERLNLRINLSNEYDIAFQAQMWLQFLRNNLKTGNSNIPTLFFPKEKTGSNLFFTLFYRKLTKFDVWLLGDYDMIPETVEDFNDLSTEALRRVDIKQTNQNKGPTPLDLILKKDFTLEDFSKMKL
jgi:hypothetical protein